MDIYLIGKYLHIVLAIAWLGGAFGMVLLGTLAARANDSARLGHVIGMIETLAPRVFIPSTVLILVIGLYLTWANWAFSEAWIVFGLVGIFITGFIGARILTPMTEEANAMDPGPEKDALMRKMLRSARGDMIMLAVIVWAMVSKPQWSDVTEVAAMAVIIVASLVIFVRR